MPISPTKIPSSRHRKKCPPATCGATPCQRQHVWAMAANARSPRGRTLKCKILNNPLFSETFSKAAVYSALRAHHLPLFLWGAAHSILDVLNKHFQTVIPGMNHAHSSMVQVMFYLGYFVMAIPAGILIDRRGYRTGVVAGLLLYGFGALLFWPGAQVMSFNFFLVSLFIIACGLVFLETAANPYVTELGDRETAPSRLNLAQSFNGLGCVCGPLFGGLLLFSDGGGNERIALPYVAMAVVALLVAVVFTRVKLPEISHADTDAGAPNAAQGHVLTRLFKNKAFMFGLFALFSYEVSEISINSFFINYVADGGWMTPRDASIALSFGGLGLFMLGRVVGSIVMQHVGSERVLRLCAIGTFVTTFAVVLNLGVLSMAALVLVYVFESIMFPTIFACRCAGSVRSPSVPRRCS